MAENVFDAAVAALGEDWTCERVRVVGVSRANLGDEYEFTCTREGLEVVFDWTQE